MKNLLLSLLCLWSFSTTLSAQATHNIWKIMEDYVQKQLDVPIPNEAQQLKLVLEDAAAEGEEEIKTEALVLQLRRAYWELEFVSNHQQEIAEAKEEYTKEPEPLIPVPNPPLIDTCIYNIAIILDRSGSILESEREQLELNLDTFIDQLVGTNFSLTFIGMSTATGTAINSTTETYSPGDPSIHQGWLDANFTTSGSRGSWRSGLEAAAELGRIPNLVIIISDGTTGEDQDRIEAANWANDLKTWGCHLFSLSQAGNTYSGATYLEQVMAVIDPNPMLANPPALLSNISNSDFTNLPTDQFLTTAGWLDAISGAVASVETGWVADTACVIQNMVIAGTYDTCQQASPPVSIMVEFWRDGVFTGVSVEPDLRPDNTWHYRNLVRRVVEMGLEFGTHYDIYPILTLANGLTIRGDEYEAGVNNDLFIAPRSNATVIVNNRIDHPDLSLSQLCAGGPIYYHGIDPLTPNHHSAIQRRPLGSNQAFDEYRRFGWVGSTLDGYVGDLKVQYPGYFEPGYEYLLTIATAYREGCITWTPVEVVFEIIDCCAPEFSIGELPNCANTGNSFLLCIDIEAPILAENIKTVYSANSDYDVDLINITQMEESLEICLKVNVNNDNCSGTPLILDIAQAGCSNTIWVMTEPLLACVGPCEFMKITDWQASPSCRWLDGQIARDFCIDFFSDAPVSELFAGGNINTCQVDLQQIVVSDLGGDSYQVCGTMVFEDPECTGHAEVTLNFSIGDKCCKLSQNFSFPGGCDPFDLCLFEDPVIDLFDRRNSEDQLYFITDLPVGSTIQLNDLINGSSQSATIQMIPCQWESELNGEINSTATCPGFIVPINTEVNCNPFTDESPTIIYNYEIRVGNCSWQLKGDYCDLFTAEPTIIFPNEGQENIPLGEKRSEAHTPSLSGPRVYPNPVQERAWLQFDLSAQAQQLHEILITNIQGQRIAQFPTQARTQFAVELPANCSAGLYFVSFVDQQGQVQSHQQLIVLY